MLETGLETIWRSAFDLDILSLEATLCLRKRYCVYGRLMVSPGDTLSLRRTRCLSERHIVSPEDTLSLGKTNCLLRLNNDCRSSLACRSVARSLGRLLAPSITGSLDRSLARSLARSLTWAFFKAHTKGRPSAATTKEAARPFHWLGIEHIS